LDALRIRPGGFKFRRQHPFGPYTLDFFCFEAAIAIEVDGLDFGSNPQRDIRRDQWLAREGIKTIRFGALDVRDNLEGVVTMIAEQCPRRTPR
jgi:very-short-patch-repair endonuclease